MIKVVGTPGRHVAVPAECTDVTLAAGFDRESGRKTPLPLTARQHVLVIAIHS
ncbi:MAG: hypothetical protein ACJ72I_13790 [Pseudonocardiaceae bacterium]|jgi:hypothetical protein